MLKPARAGDWACVALSSSPRVGPDDHRHQFPALKPQVAPQRVLMIPAEIPHDLFQVHDQVHRRLIQWQMLVAGHRAPTSRGRTPPAPPNHPMTQITQSSIRIRIHATTDTPEEGGANLTAG